MDKLDEKLIILKERLRMRHKLTKILSEAENMLRKEMVRKRQLEAKLIKEEEDVKKLEKLSLTGLFYTILGSKEKQLGKERQEYLSAKLRYDECIESINAIKYELSSLKNQIDELEHLEEQYQSLMAEKEKFLLDSNNETAKKLIQVTEQIAEVQGEIREIQEAIDAGQAVLGALQSVIDSLKKARNWGTWDMLGGGIISTAVKHSKIDNAREAAHRVQRLLRHFNRELEDVNISSERELGIKVNDFAKFADFFFDSLISDWIVQSKIKNSLKSAEDMNSKVGSVMQKLHKKLKGARTRLNRLIEERSKLIENTEK